ncbi:MAG: hypothetical protein ACON35_03350 [Candidatus Marinamargulisbacteria bacterium]
MKKTVSVNIKYPRIRLEEYKHLSRDLLLNLKEFLTHCIKLKIFEKNSYIYENYAGNKPKQIQRLMKGEVITIYFRNDIRQIYNLFDNLNPAQFRGKNCTITGRHFQNLLNPIKEILGDNFHITNSTDSLKDVFNKYITTLWNNLFKSQKALSFNGKDFDTLYQECGTTTNAFTTFAYLGMDTLIATIKRLSGNSSALAAIDAGCEELSEMRKLTLGYANTHPEIDLIPFYDENRLRTYETTLMLLHDRYAVEQSKMAPLVESSFQLKDEKKLSSQPRIDASADLTQENENLRAEIAKIRAENERLLTEDQQRRAAMTELREEKNGAVADASLPLVVSPLKHSTGGKRDLFQLHYTPADIEAAAAEIAKTAGASTQSTTHSTDDFKQFLSLSSADREKIKMAMVKAEKKRKMGVPDGAIFLQLKQALNLTNSNESKTLDELIKSLKRFLSNHTKKASNAAAESKRSARVNPLHAQIKQNKNQGLQAMLTAQLGKR